MILLPAFLCHMAGWLAPDTLQMACLDELQNFRRYRPQLACVTVKLLLVLGDTSSSLTPLHESAWL